MSQEKNLTPSLRIGNNGRSRIQEDDNTMPSASQSPTALPRWLWCILANVVGVKDRGLKMGSTSAQHWLAILLRTFTCISALIFFVTHVWTVLFSIMNNNNSSIRGSASIVMAVCWCGAGIYSRNVAHRMLGHPTIGHRVQLVFQSIFRINIALLIIILNVVLLSVNNYSVRLHLNIEQKNNGTTYEIAVVREVMFATRICFSGFALLWNIAVIFILMSTCRSYTLGIRRFIRDLESDASAYNRHCVKTFSGAELPPAEYNIFSEYIWLDEDNSETTFASQMGNSGSPFKGKLGQCPYSAQKDMRLNLTTISELTESPDSEISCSDIVIQHPNDEFNSFVTNLGKTTFVSECFARKAQSPNTCSSSVSGSERESFDAEANLSQEKLHLLTLDEILHRYWKISCRLRLLSCALQRWMVCFFAMCFGWTISYLTYWLTHAPMLLDVLQFVIPLVLIPLICSAYAEVNYEGKRLLKFVCPLEERFFMIDYLNSNPLQMVVYDFQVTYSAIVTAILGLLLALSSGIILQEMTRN